MELLSGRLEQAEHGLREALEILRKNPADTIVLAHTLSTLSSISLRKQDYSAAESLARESIALLTERYGPAHPDLARDLTQLANVYLRTARPEEAVALLVRALPLAEAAFGPDDALVRNVLVAYAEALRRLKRNAEARPLERRAREIARLLNEQNAGRHVVDAQTLSPRR